MIDGEQAIGVSEGYHGIALPDAPLGVDVDQGRPHDVQQALLQGGFPGPIVSRAKLRDALGVHVESDDVELASKRHR